MNIQLMNIFTSKIKSRQVTPQTLNSTSYLPFPLFMCALSQVYLSLISASK